MLPGALAVFTGKLRASRFEIQRPQSSSLTLTLDLHQRLAHGNRPEPNKAEVQSLCSYGNQLDERNFVS